MRKNTLYDISKYALSDIFTLLHFFFLDEIKKIIHGIMFVTESIRRNNFAI